MLETVLTHLLVASVFASLLCLLVHLLTHSSQGALEFFHCDAAVIIQIELVHEQFNFFLEWGEPVGLSEELLNLIWSDGATAIFINSAEGALELFIREDIDAKGVYKICLESVGRSQSRYSKEGHFYCYGSCCSDYKFLS